MYEPIVAPFISMTCVVAGLVYVIGTGCSGEIEAGLTAFITAGLADGIRPGLECGIGTGLIWGIEPALECGIAVRTGPKVCIVISGLLEIALGISVWWLFILE